MWAILPVKNLDAAKQRLVDVLSPTERRLLLRAMLEDVLATLSHVAALDGVAVVSRDPVVASLARSYGALLMMEAESRGQSAAVSMAAVRLAAEGVDGMIMVPADVPLATPAEIGKVLAAVHGPALALTIVPARDENGSNCVACSPADCIPFRFGDGSFFAHLEEARCQGITPRVLHLPGLGLDIDTPADLGVLLDRPGDTRTHAYLAESGIARRLGKRGCDGGPIRVTAGQARGSP